MTKEYENTWLDFEDDGEDIVSARYKKIRTIAKDVVVYTTDWTTETIINQINKGAIDLNPEFQRRDAWNPGRKSQYIESLILGLPVPAIVLAESKTDKGKFIVIDGKQRLLSIRQFYSSRDDSFAPLRLTGLKILKSLSGKTKTDLESVIIQDGEFVDLSSLENQPIRTIIIRNWKDENLLYEIFIRLNLGSLPLSPQELRQALHPGPFIDFIERRSRENAPIQSLLSIKAPDRRMRDAEILLRYYSFHYFANSYGGDLKRFFDETCKKLNKSWPTISSSIDSLIGNFNESMHVVSTVFGEKNMMRKWSGDRFEARLNRAVFDVMMYYLTNDSIRGKFLHHGNEIVEEFKRLCDEDYTFRSSLESSTSKLNQTQSRFTIWGQALGRIIGEDIVIPKITNEYDDIEADTELAEDELGDGRYQ